MIKFLDNPLTLEEHTVLVSTSCYQCDVDIDIGDSCYVDTSESAEERHVKTYCEACFQAAMDELI